MFISEKRGVSLMVAYTLLVVIAIALSVIVSSYLTQFLPSEREECPADINLIIEEASCITTNQQLSVTVSNRGLFTVSGMFVRFAREGREVRPQINIGREVLPVPLEPNSDSLSFTFDVSNQNILAGQKYILEIQPAILSKRVLIPCENIVTTMLQCTPEGGGGNQCGDGNITDGEQCDGNNLNSTTCNDLGYDGGTLSCDSNCQFDTSQCTNDGGSCTPKTCADYNNPECGIFADGCGGTIDCNTCAQGEYCSNNGTYGECRQITSCIDDYEKTDQSEWWFFGENWLIDDKENPFGVYHPANCQLFEKDGEGNDSLIEVFNDTCLDSTTLQQYYCVNKTDAYGIDYQTCENLPDFIYDTKNFDCENNYYGPYCIINDNPTSCTTSCWGEAYGECAPYWNDPNYTLCYGGFRDPDHPEDGNYCTYDTYGEKAFCYSYDLSC